MPSNDFVRFCSEYLPQQPALAKKLGTLTNLRSRAQAMVDAGHSAGFAFTAAEAEEGLRASERKIREADGELSDAQLDAVAGGTLSLMEATQSVAEATQSVGNALQEATQMGARKSR